MSLYNPILPLASRSWNVLRRILGCDVPDSFLVPSSVAYVTVPWVALAVALGGTLGCILPNPFFMASKNSILACIGGAL